ncbi:hypothetical protein [Pseudenhygromyxa sp. WMMC2535]|uniref:hypothetical protein n=1 Tax=Pseudenhygromyxa sp. WMMC2535 TaxID=2712867 RepID=UPI0023DDE3DC|nr:hypothetical protein [Pseudenhygromyxa sp. WMMC2535]
MAINDDRGLEREADIMGARAIDVGRSSSPESLSVGEPVRSSGCLRGAVQREVIQMDGDDDVEELDRPPALAPPLTVAQLITDFWEAPSKRAFLSNNILALENEAMASDFLYELSSNEEGKKALESAAKSGFSEIPYIGGYIPNIMSKTSLHPAPQVAVGATAGIVTLVAGGLLLGAQRLISEPIRSKISNKKNWIKRLMSLEFGVTFSGRWNEKELIKTYIAFHRVPRGTAKACIDYIDRNWSSGSFAQETSQNKPVPGPLINMGMLVPTEVTMGSIEPYSALVSTLSAFNIFNSQTRFKFKTGAFLKNGSLYSKRMRTKNAWTMTVLHEVGHAVDFKRKVMDTHGEDSNFGGWKTHRPSTLARDMLASMQTPVTAPNGVIDANFSQYNWDKLVEQSIELVVHKQPIESAFAESEAQTNVTFNQRTKNAIKYAIMAHPATNMIKKNRPLGAWERGDSTMQNMAQPFNGRYFHRSYPGKISKDTFVGIHGDTDTWITDSNSWVSFEVESRKDAVSNYQYRAPGEWFAELYAHYYMGTLEGHPLERWFEREIDQELNPDAVLGVPNAPTAEDLNPDANDN